MILKNEGLLFIPSDEDDPLICQLHDEQSETDNLSERYQHPRPLPDKLSFRLEHNDEVIGFVVLKSMRWFNRKAELSLFIKMSYRGKGFGLAALSTITRYVFNTLNFHRLEAEVFAYNKTALKLFESFGFQREGLLREARFYDGKYYDIIRFGLLAREWSA